MDQATVLLNTQTFVFGEKSGNKYKKGKKAAISKTALVSLAACWPMQATVVGQLYRF
jgi:hypothetical protein